MLLTLVPDLHDLTGRVDRQLGASGGHRAAVCADPSFNVTAAAGQRSPTAITSTIRGSTSSTEYAPASRRVKPVRDSYGACLRP
jgi:hypothetical protein